MILSLSLSVSVGPAVDVSALSLLCTGETAAVTEG